MAGVWEAHDELLGRAVAVKVLASHLSEDERARRRFEREARAAAGLSSHPHVVTIYDVGEHDGRAFMVMELMRGGTVGERLKAGRAIADETALRWLREAAGALDAAHEAGVVHRDIKPGNLLLDERDRLAIADFGIARLAMEDQLTATGQVLGTASYISPEQAVGEPATAASDRYALAVVAFELLTGERPFRAEHFAAQARAHVEDEPPLATERDPSLPRGVDAVLDRGMAKTPADRWDSATAMVAALDRAMSSSRPATEPTRPIAPPPDAGPPPQVERAGRGGGPWLLAGLAGLILIAVLGFLLLSGGDGGRSESPADREATATATATPTAERTPEATREATPEPTQEATPEPTATATPEPTGGGPDLERAADLQVQGFNARRAGNYEQALALSQQALDACGDARELSPCGFALFEVGAALNALGRPDEAIPYLEQRLAQYGDNGAGEVKRELKDAQKAAKKG
jgi:tetratricopeptide (TPR) repeat protein